MIDIGIGIAVGNFLIDQFRGSDDEKQRVVPQTGTKTSQGRLPGAEQTASSVPARHVDDGVDASELEGARDIPQAKTLKEHYMDRIDQDPGATMRDIMANKNIEEKDKQELMMYAQQKLNEQNQFFTMMSNLERAEHETLKALIANFRA